MDTTTTAPGQIYAAMIAVMKDIDAITKSRTTQAQGNYKYRGIDDIYNALHPIFAEHGVFCAPRVQKYTQTEKSTAKGGIAMWTVIEMEYRFYASDGSFVSATTLGEAMDSGDKSAGKAEAYAHKVCLLQVFAIPTNDPDNDIENGKHEFGREQPSQPREERKPATPKPAKPPAQQPAAKAPAAEMTAEEVDAIVQDREFARLCDDVGAGIEMRQKIVRKYKTLDAAIAATKEALAKNNATKAETTRAPAPSASLPPSSSTAPAQSSPPPSSSPEKKAAPAPIAETDLPF